MLYAKMIECLGFWPASMGNIKRNYVSTFVLSLLNIKSSISCSLDLPIVPKPTSISFRNLLPKSFFERTRVFPTPMRTSSIVTVDHLSRSTLGVDRRKCFSASAGTKNHLWHGFLRRSIREESPPGLRNSLFASRTLGGDFHSVKHTPRSGIIFYLSSKLFESKKSNWGT
jgi:hypothetical protein